MKRRGRWSVWRAMLFALLLAAAPPFADVPARQAFAEIAASADGVGTAGGAFVGSRLSLGPLFLGGRFGALHGSLAYFTPSTGFVARGTRFSAIADVGPALAFGPAVWRPTFSVGAGFDLTPEPEPVLVTATGLSLELPVRPDLSVLVGARVQSTLGYHGLSGGLLLTSGLSFAL